MKNCRERKDNIWLKLLCTMLTAVMMLSFVASCAPKEDGQGSNTDISNEKTDTEAETQRVKTPLNIIENGKTEYTMIRPENTSTELLSFIQSFREELNKKLEGKQIGIAEDFVYANQKPAECEILLGKTNREETKLVLSTLKSKDFAIDIVDKKLVIVGHTDEKTMEGIKYFMENVVKPQTEKNLKVEVEQCHTEREEYDISEIKINDVPVYKFNMVVSVYATQYEKECAEALADGISAKSGYVINIVKDSEKEQEYEILVGETNRQQSKDTYKGLKIEDYLYKVVDNKLVVAGGDENTLMKAVISLKSKIYQKSVADKAHETLLTNKDDFTFKYDKYLCDTIKLNGSDITNYSIVYRKDDSQANSMAIQLRNIISSNVGIVLDIHTDSTASETEREILIGESNRTDKGGAAEELKKSLESGVDKGLIACNDKYIFIAGGAAGGFRQAFKEFTSKLLPEKQIKGVYEIAYEAAKKVVSEFEQIKVMSFNIWTDNWIDYRGQDVRRRDQVVSIIREYMPDVIGMQEAKRDSVAYLAKKLPEYSYVNTPRDKASYESTPIFYNSQKFNLIESGTQWLSETPDKMSVIEGSAYYRIYTYVVLESKATGARFVHVNTHLDYRFPANDKQMEILLDLTKRFSDMPMFYTADWNMSFENLGYKLITNAGYGDSAKMAQESIQAGTFGDSVIDFCFTSKTATLVTKYKVIRDHKYSDTASDHYPIYVEMSIIK